MQRHYSAAWPEARAAQEQQQWHMQYPQQYAYAVPRQGYAPPWQGQHTWPHVPPAQHPAHHGPYFMPSPTDHSHPHPTPWEQPQAPAFMYTDAPRSPLGPPRGYPAPYISYPAHEVPYPPSYPPYDPMMRWRPQAENTPAAHSIPAPAPAPAWPATYDLAPQPPAASSAPKQNGLPAWPQQPLPDPGAYHGMLQQAKVWGQGHSQELLHPPPYMQQPSQVIPPVHPPLPPPRAAPSPLPPLPSDPPQVDGAGSPQPEKRRARDPRLHSLPHTQTQPAIQALAPALQHAPPAFAPTMQPDMAEQFQRDAELQQGAAPAQTQASRALPKAAHSVDTEHAPSGAAHVPRASSSASMQEQPQTVPACDTTVPETEGTAAGTGAGAGAGAVLTFYGKSTTISCPHCAQLGMTYSKVFYGRRVDPVTGKEVPIDFLHLPNVVEGMGHAEFEANGKSLRCLKHHVRSHHPAVIYKPKYGGFTTRGKTKRDRVGDEQDEDVAPMQSEHSIAVKPASVPAITQPAAQPVTATAPAAKLAAQPHPAASGPDPEAPGSNTTLVVCFECVRAGKTQPYAKPFIGRHIEALTGKEVPLNCLHLPNSAQSDEEAALNGHSYECFRKHYSARHKNVKYQPKYKGFIRPDYRSSQVPAVDSALPAEDTLADYDGFTRRGKKQLLMALNAGHSPPTHPVADTPSSPSLRTCGTVAQRPQATAKAPASPLLHACATGGQQAPVPDVSSLGAGAYLSEALVQAADQLRGLDLHPVHPPVGSGMRTRKVLCKLLGDVGILGDENMCGPHAMWLWDTDEWEPTWMSEETLKRVAFDDLTSLTRSTEEDALIGREWRALQTAWRAAERRYASVLEELQQGRQVPDMNGCYEIQNLRMLVKSLNAYVTVCGGESAAGSTPGAHTQPWTQLLEDRVWEVATELAEDMYERRVTQKARTTPTTTQPAVTDPPPPVPSPPPAAKAESDDQASQSDMEAEPDIRDRNYTAKLGEEVTWQAALQEDDAGASLLVVSAAERVKMRKRQKTQGASSAGGRLDARWSDVGFL